MIKFDSFSLNNGLRVILNKDDKTPLVAVNILYEVGAKNENPNATGFAHLFEHLMFAGSKQFPSYDEAVQIMGGESNAFTNNDFTNYYLTLPAEFLFHALRLEADRMQYLNINTKSLEVQRKVVIEEFKQRYINQPYGDLWKEIRQLAYKQHPYQWQTIGKEISHIENATLEQVSEFYDNYYQASNAILSISGNVNIDTVKANLDSTFGKIPYKKTIFQPYEMEAKQTEVRQNTVYRDVPSSVICLIFPMSDRKSSLYYSQDL
jgi:predicted Zn-dependent peptidase